MSTKTYFNVTTGAEEVLQSIILDNHHSIMLPYFKM